MTWTHDALQEDLAQYLRDKTQRMVWTNMQMGPAGSPRPDAYSLPFSFTRFTPLAYEVKISVADFRRDVTAGKWQSYLRYAAGVTFAAPAGLIAKGDIPEGCGLLLRSEAGWRAVKAPTLRPVENLPLEAWIKLLIDGLERQVKLRYPQAAEEYGLIYRVEQRLGKEVSRLLHDRRAARYRYESATESLNKSAKAAEAAYRKTLDDARKNAERDAARIDGARAELAQALGLPPDARTFEITNAAQAAARRLEADAEVQRLRSLFERVESAIASVDRPLPEIARAV
nr:MAG TPA: DNA repair protein MmcB-like protein [Caudoviricetes sp.]